MQCIWSGYEGSCPPSVRRLPSSSTHVGWKWGRRFSNSLRLRRSRHHCLIVVPLFFPMISPLSHLKREIKKFKSNNYNMSGKARNEMRVHDTSFIIIQNILWTLNPTSGWMFHLQMLYSSLLLLLIPLLSPGVYPILTDLLQLWAIL